MKERLVAYVGVDVSKDTLSIDAGTTFTGTVANTAQAIRGLLRKVAKRIGGEHSLLVCFESTGPYGEQLFLECCEAGVPACVLNPAQVRQYAKAMSESAKTDPIDARVIRLFAECRRPKPTPPPSRAAVSLRKLVLVRNALMKSIVQLSGTLDSVATDEAGKVLAKAVADLRKRVKELDAKIAEAVAGDERLSGLVGALSEIEGVGVLTAATVVALVPEIGTLGRRRSAAIAGLAPFTRDSGRFKGKTFVSGGRAEVRRSLFMPATVAIRFNSVPKAAYAALRKNGKPYKVALTAVMRRLFAHMDATAAKWLRLQAAAVPAAT